MTLFNLAFSVHLLAFSLMATEVLEIPREDGSSLFAYSDVPKDQEAFPLAIILQSSQPETARRFHDSLKQGFAELGIGIVSLEKKGIKPSGEIDRKAFRLAQSIDLRVDDHLLLKKKLDQGLINGWNGKILILGQGEGGRIGAILANRFAPVAALILVAPGGAWSPRDELLSTFRSEMTASGFSPLYIQSFLVQAKEQLQLALKNPNSDLEAFGFSLKYWASLLKTDLLASLSPLDCPIYCIYGALDDHIPEGSVNALIERLEKKPNFSVKQYADAGREVVRNPATYKDAMSWLSAQEL